MGVLSDRLDGLQVRASSPNGKVTAELNGRADVRVTFAPRAYVRYDEAGLASDLTKVAAQLMAARTRLYHEAVSEAFQMPLRREPPPLSPRDREYDAARDDLLVEGRSSDGRIRITTRGLRSWRVRIAEGTLSRLTEQQFSAGVAEAACGLIEQQMSRIRGLKHHVYHEQGH